MIFHALAAIGDMLRRAFFMLVFCCWAPLVDFGQHFGDFGVHFGDFGAHFGDFGMHFSNIGAYFAGLGCLIGAQRLQQGPLPGCGQVQDAAGNSVLPPQCSMKPVAGQWARAICHRP